MDSAVACDPAFKRFGDLVSICLLALTHSMRTFKFLKALLARIIEWLEAGISQKLIASILIMIRKYLIVLQVNPKKLIYVSRVTNVCFDANCSFYKCDQQITKKNR